MRTNQFELSRENLPLCAKEGTSTVLALGYHTFTAETLDRDSRGVIYGPFHESGLKMREKATVTLTADKEGRLTCRQLFPPGAVFAAELEGEERVMLRKLDQQINHPAAVIVR